jgi:hypothetical protein
MGRERGRVMGRERGRVSGVRCRVGYRIRGRDSGLRLRVWVRVVRGRGRGRGWRWSCLLEDGDWRLETRGREGKEGAGEGFECKWMSDGKLLHQTIWEIYMTHGIQRFGEM